MKNKWEPMSREKLAIYNKINDTFVGHETMSEDILAHAERMQTINGKGIELLSYLNKDYLGFFMSPFSRDIKNADIVIAGIPIEGSSPINSSHKLAPTELRKVSKLGMGTVTDDMKAPFEMCRVIDYGNIDVFGQFELKKEIDLAEKHLLDIVAAGADPFLIGGDHSITWPPLRALGEKYGPLSVIHFDAHYDLTTKAQFAYEYTSGSYFARAFAGGYVDPERVIQIGIRGKQTFLLQEIAKQFGTNSFTADEVWDLGTDVIADKILEVVGDGPTYLTFDLDSLDPSCHVSNSGPEPFGLTTRQVYDIIRKIRDKVNLVGADISEYAPMYDANGRDAIVTCGIAWKIFAWLCTKRAERQGEWRKTEWPMAMGYASI